MAVGLPFAIALEAPESVLDAVRVDCPTCPVSFACLARQGGTGYKWACCGSTGIETQVDGRKRLLVLDCAINNFGVRNNLDDFKVCPLCSGDIAVSVELDLIEWHLYVPTVHAKFPASVRRRIWQEARKEARKLKEKIKKP